MLQGEKPQEFLSDFARKILAAKPSRLPGAVFRCEPS
jgi:hypothetical protein